MAFNHDKLKVYQRALAFNRKVGLWVAQWDGRHAVCDQLSRAAGSMLENIAMASAACSAMKQRCRSEQHLNARRVWILLVSRTLLMRRVLFPRKRSSPRSCACWWA